MIERLQQGSREAASKMNRNKDTAYNTLEVTKNAGVSLEQALGAVARITRLNQEASHTAQGQKEVARNVIQGVESIKAVGDANRNYATEVAISCNELVDQIKQMQAQLRRYRF
jgi:methyl-accepting chemotaxis protein